MPTVPSPRPIAVVLYPGCAFLDVAAALHALAGCATEYHVTTVAARIRPLAGAGALRLLAERTFDELPRPAVLVVPGGGAPALAAHADPQLVAYVREAGARAELVAAVGIGSLLLAASGLLRGRAVAPPPGLADVLRTYGARHRPDDVVEDGPCITAVDSLAALELALTLAARLGVAPTPATPGEAR